uniref:DNA excision repair protein ERCC-6-like 2 isoform X2 n=1 Tax=Actinia tenebrosa TaxID=6105 RepID=A0A6P8HG51_ACTTE
MNDKSDDETEDEPSQEICGDRKKERSKESPNIKSGQTDVDECKDVKNDKKPKKPEWIQKEVKCMALYHGDNLYYRAVIDDVVSEDQVEVTFIGFESEGKERVPFKHLRRIPQNIIPTKSVDEDTNSTEAMQSLSKESFFTHLEGFELNEEIRTKYEDFDDIDFDIPLQEVKQNKRKGVLDILTHKGGKVLKKKQRKKASMNTDDTDLKTNDRERDIEDTKRTLSKERRGSPGQDDCTDVWCDMDGFDDKDMEKPRFSEPAPYPFVPLVLSEPGIEPPIQVPATINCRLREYQRDGVRFLYRHYHDNKGAILGDDMGLGKTVQVIAFLAAVMGKTGTKIDVFGKYMSQGKKHANEKTEVKRCFLVVSPGSVLYNWRDELDTWGHFKVKVYHGNSKEGVLEEAMKKKLDVVLTTYDTLRINLTKFNKVSWSAVIMDEVHKLKDPEAQITVAAKELKVKARFGLTGTPLQNRFDEFWSVLDWANPGCLGSARKFTKEYSKPIKKGQRYDVTKRELAIGRTISRNFQAKLGQWFLRRTKDLISDQLPQKDERVVFCNLTQFQEDVYVTLLQSPDVQLITKKDDPCDCGSGLTRGHCCYTSDENGESLRSVLMRYLQLMLKAANHTALLMPQVKQTEDQRTKLLDILEEYLIGRGMIYSRLDGKTKTSLRPVIVRDFNNNTEIFVCLVSTKAGALGLNFTGANVVIIFDPTWNPANDLQAQDRAYRIGQRRDVQVFRLITSGTIEEMIYLRQVYKQQMANIAVRGTSERRYFIGVEGEKDLKGELFGMENLFSYRAEGVSLAHDIIQRTDKLEAGLRVEKYNIIAKENNEDEETNRNEDNKANANTSEDEDDYDYDLEEMASQYFEDENETQQHDNEEASTSGINVKDNGGKKRTRLSDEEPITDSVQSSSNMSLENDKNVKEKKMNKKKKKKKRKMVGAPRAKDQRQRRLRKYVSEFFSCSESSGSEKSECGDSVSSGDGNRMDVETQVGRQSGRQEGKESDSEVDVVETDKDVTIIGQTDRNTDIRGYRRTDKHEDTVKLRQTGKEKTRKQKTKLGQTDNKKDKMSDIDSEEESRKSAFLDSRQRFTRIRQKQLETRLNKNVSDKEGNEKEMEGSVRIGASKTMKARPDSRKSAINENDLKNYRQKHTNETDSHSHEEFSGNQEGCHGNEGYLSMSCDESNQSDHEEEPLLPSTRIVSRGARKRARIESRLRGKRSLAESLNNEDQGMDNKDNKVEEILSKCGVRYTHANRSVVRTSKAESHMSKRAIEDVFELRQFSQQPANCFAAFEASEESDDVAEFTTCQSKSKSKKQNTKKPSTHSRTDQETHSSAARSKAASSSKKPIDGTTEVIDGATVIIGGTPRGIRRNQFSEMSRCFGFASEVDFAVNLVKETPDSLRESLKAFYIKSNPDLIGLKYFAEENIVEKATTSKREKRAKMTTARASESKGRESTKTRNNDTSGKTAKGRKVVKEKAKMASVGKGRRRRRRGVVFDDDDNDDDDRSGSGGGGGGDDDEEDGDGDDYSHKENKKRKSMRRKQKKIPCIKDDDDDNDESADNNDDGGCSGNDDGGCSGNDDGDGGGEYKLRKDKVRESTERNKKILDISVDNDDGSDSGKDNYNAQKNTLSTKKRNQRKVPRVTDDDDDGYDRECDDNQIYNNENKDDDNNPKYIKDVNLQEVTADNMNPGKRHFLRQTSNSVQVMQQSQYFASSSLSILDEFLGPTRKQESANAETTSVGLPVLSTQWQQEANAQSQFRSTQKSSEGKHNVEGSKDHHLKRSILDDFI